MPRPFRALAHLLPELGGSSDRRFVLPVAGSSPNLVSLTTHADMLSNLRVWQKPLTDGTLALSRNLLLCLEGRTKGWSLERPLLLHDKLHERE